MGILDNLEAYMDNLERSGHTCAFETDVDGMLTCKSCGAVKHDENN
jgi:hypothetical protein